MTERDNVFISYSREYNLQAAINLRDQLLHAGLSVFRDEDNIREGSHWLEKLQQAIDQCQCFVLLAGRGGSVGGESVFSARRRRAQCAMGDKHTTRKPT